VALIYADRVKETTVTTGTGDLALGGAMSSYQPFSIIGAGNTCYYCVLLGAQWEVGLGTYLAGPDRLARSPLSSSSGGSLVDFAAGTKEVFLTMSATALSSIGGDKTYTHDQVTPSALWSITHNLNKVPSITIVDSSGREVEGEVEHVNLNSVILSFGASFAGKAYLN
jgi:hypothetical protein